MGVGLLGRAWDDVSQTIVTPWDFWDNVSQCVFTPCLAFHDGVKLWRRLPNLEGYECNRWGFGRILAGFSLKCR